MTNRLALITLWLAVTAITAAPRQKRQSTNVVINADASRYGYTSSAVNDGDAKQFMGDISLKNDANRIVSDKEVDPSLLDTGNDALKDKKMTDDDFVNHGLTPTGNTMGAVDGAGVYNIGGQGGACNDTRSGCVMGSRGGLFGMLAALMNAVGRLARHIMINASRMNNTGTMTVVVGNETLVNDTAGMMGGGIMGGGIMGGMANNNMINVTGGMMGGDMMGGMMGGGMMGGGMMGRGMMGPGSNKTMNNRGGMFAMMVRIMSGKRRIPSKKPCTDDCVLDKGDSMATVTSDLHQNNADRHNTLRNQERINILSLLLKKKKAGLHSKLLRLLRKANL